MSGGRSPGRKRSFSKGEFNQYVSSNCHRQLFLELSERGENWQDWRLNEEIVEYDKSIDRPIQAFQLREGKKYQAIIYTELSRIGHLQATYNPKLIQNPVIRPPEGAFYPLTSKVITESLPITSISPVLLIEHKYEVPKGFQDNFFELPLSACIPDILYLRSIQTFEGEMTKVLTEAGRVETLNIKQNSELSLLSVVDIKATAVENVSNKHFSEILYYLQTLNAWIYDQSLQNVVRVSIMDNGIFGRTDKFQPTLIEETVKHPAFVSLPYEDIEILWTKFVADLQNIHQQKPTDRQAFPVNFGIYCEQC
ncbi:MAG: hypothetical protein IH840_08280, partial [Candidatus Heimdallarchaeota archaeon]|nr:hypothetical protein [Candidatus Heimdallarchaeota archaeon]